MRGWASHCRLREDGPFGDDNLTRDTSQEKMTFFLSKPSLYHQP